MTKDTGGAVPAAFACRRCGTCCRQSGFVYLRPAEPEGLAAFFGMEPFDFVNQYCDLIDRRRLVLKKQVDESCVFLQGSGCRVYAARPVQCKGFPSDWRTSRSSDYCLGLKSSGGYKEGL